MTQPWKVLDSVATDEGTLELRQRGERDFLITVNSLVLMNSSLHRSDSMRASWARHHEGASCGIRSWPRRWRSRW